MVTDNFGSELNKVKTTFAELKTIRKMKELDLLSMQQNHDVQEQNLLDTEKARAVILLVSAEVQKNLEYQISSIVTMALAAVFDDPMEFKAKFVEKRNQTEVEMFFVQNGKEYDPMDDGGGAKDIASLALRMAIWSIKKTRALMILDEPSISLSRDMQSKASELLKMLSTELGIQMIIVSHIPEIMECADRVFMVEKINGVSKVTVK